MLKTSYYLLFIALWSVIMYIYYTNLKEYFGPTSTLKKVITASTVIIVWLLLQYFISRTGFYLEFSLPPRIPLFMIMPFFIFTIAFMVKNRSGKLLIAIPIVAPIAYQSFRAIIEILFYWTHLQNILPVQVTFEGANYDVLLGVSAIPMALYALRKDASKKVLIIWNYIGIAVVGFAAFTFISSFYFPEIWGGSQSNISIEFNQFPFLILPIFFMPSAVFMHVLSIVQLNYQLNTDKKSL